MKKGGGYREVLCEERSKIERCASKAGGYRDELKDCYWTVKVRSKCANG